MGGSSAPSVPDYSSQNMNTARQENAKRQHQADIYNTQMNALNNYATNAFNQGRDYLSSLGSWNYTDYLKATNDKTGKNPNQSNNFWTPNFNQSLTVNPNADPSDYSSQYSNQLEALKELAREEGANGNSGWVVQQSQALKNDRWQNYRPEQLGQLTNWVSGDQYKGGVNAWTGQTGAWDMGEFRQGYQSLLNNFDMLNSWSGQLKPLNFSPTIQGYDRPLNVDTPGLISYQGKEYANQLNAMFQQANNQLSQFDQRMSQDKNTLNSTLAGWGNNFNQLEEQISGLNMNNVDDLGASLKRKLQQSQQGLGNINNDYYYFLKSNNLGYDYNGQSLTDYTGSLKTGYSSLLDQITKLEKDREAEAARVSNFQQQMTGNLNSLYGKLSNAGLAEYDKIYKDAAKQFEDYRSQADGFKSNYEHYNGSQQAQMLQRIQTELAGYKSAYDMESQRVKSYQDSITNQLDQYQNAIGGLGIADDKAMGNYARYLDTLQQQMGRFNSELGVKWDNQNATLGQLRGQLTDLGNKRTAEQQRIDDFQKQFGLDIGGLSNDIDSAGINDASKIDALRKRYSTLADQLAGFKSELNPQMGTLMNQLGREQSDLEGLSNKRTQALMKLENEIAQMQAQAKEAERGLIGMDTSVDGANYRDLTALNNLRQQIAERQQLAGDWRSELAKLQERATTMGYDGADALTKTQGSLDKLASDKGYSALLNEIAGMQTKRQGELDTINTTLSGLQGKVKDAPIQNEADLKTYLTDLSKHLSSLSMYSGNDITSLSKGYNDAITSVNDKLTQLSTKRGEIEKQAQAMLKRMNETSYYNLGNLDGEKGSMDDIKATIELYNAQQAMDELDAMTKRLTGERQRIESDLQKSQAAQQGEANWVNQQNQQQNKPTYGTGANGLPLTEAEYLALLQQRKEKEMYGGASSFAAAMGLV